MKKLFDSFIRVYGKIAISFLHLIEALVFEAKYYLAFWVFDRGSFPGYLTGLRMSLVALLPQLLVCGTAYFCYTFGIQLREILVSTNSMPTLGLATVTFGMYLSFVLRAGDVAIKLRKVDRSSFGAKMGRFLLYVAAMFGPTMMMIQAQQDPLRAGHAERAIAILFSGNILCAIFLAIGRFNRTYLREKSKDESVRAKRAEVFFKVMRFASPVLLTLGFFVFMVTFIFVDLVPVASEIENYTISFVNFGLTVISGVFFMLMAINATPLFVKLNENYRIGSFTILIVVLILIRFVSGSFTLNSWHPDNRGVGNPRIGKALATRLTLDEALTEFDNSNIISGHSFGETLPERSRRIIFVADGGGIHAAYRASRVLAQMYETDSGSFEKIFATSTVSGGSIGTAVTYALVYAIEQRTENHEDESYSLVEQIDKYFDQNLLTPVVGRLFFTEWASMIFPASDRLDRGKALEISVRNGLQRIDPNLKEYAESFLDSGILTGEPIKKINTTLIFNTTMQATGERFLLSNLRTPTMKSLANLRNPQDVSILSAACASARFPIVTHVARVRTGFIKGVPQYAYLSDGGIYENSGLETAIELVRGIRLMEYSKEIDESAIMVAVVGNSVVGRISSEERDLSEMGPMMLDQDEYRSDISSLTSTVLNGVFTRNSANALRLRDYSDEYGFHLIYFPWCGNVMSAPLGWYLSKERRNLIDANFGFSSFAKSGVFDATASCIECKYTLGNISTLGPEPTNSSPSQQLQAVSNFNKKQMFLLTDFLLTDEFLLELIAEKMHAGNGGEAVKRHRIVHDNGEVSYVNLPPFSSVLQRKNNLAPNYQKTLGAKSE